MRHTFEGGARGMIALGVLGLAGLGCWEVATRLSSDALGMIIGLMFGILAGVPPALLVLLARLGERRTLPPPYSPPAYTPRQLPPPTVIIVQLPDGTRARALMVDGERE